MIDEKTMIIKFNQKMKITEITTSEINKHQFFTDLKNKIRCYKIKKIFHLLERYIHLIFSDVIAYCVIYGRIYYAKISAYIKVVSIKD